MKTRVRHTALLAAGALAGGAAAAIGLGHTAWFGAEKPVAAAAGSMSTSESAASTDAARAAPIDVAAEAPTDAAIAIATAATVPTAAPMAAAGDMPDFRAIVRRNGPAVVGVTVSGVQRAGDDEHGQPQQPDEDEDPYQPFFRGLPGGDPRGRANPQQPFRGQGSGFIVSADGLILTNAHVVRNAGEVMVKLSDRREYAAKVLGSDPVTDVAVLSIAAKNLPTVQLGDPSRLEVGDHVLAIGAPYGLEQTATQGIVSAKGRSLPGDSVVPFIQTDAAVNPGNSGGPLFDAQGRVVGINAQIYSRSGGFQGLSFAIPINVALKVKDQIVATGKATHARLGVSVQDVNQALAESFGMPAPAGALVSSISRGSAAAAAGLQPGDVILEVAGQPIASAGGLSSAIGLSTPGERVKLKVWREWRPRHKRPSPRTGPASAVATGAQQRRCRTGHGGRVRVGRGGPGRHPGRRRGAGDRRQALAVDRAGSHRDAGQAQGRCAAGAARRREDFRAGAAGRPAFVRRGRRRTMPKSSSHRRGNSVRCG